VGLCDGDLERDRDLDEEPVCDCEEDLVLGFD